MFKKKHSYQSAAVVTGAGSGIGQAFALEIANRGGRVVCADINLSAAQETVERIQANNGQALAVETDVTQAEAVTQLAEKAEQWFKQPVNLVVNNAGVAVGGSDIGEISLDDWRWVLGVNLWGVIHGCHVFAPKLRALGRGGIINVCSTASFAAAPQMAPYNVSKAAALALTETLSVEFSGTDIHVTALCPTWVKTNIVQSGHLSPNASKMASRWVEQGMSAETVAKQSLDALDANQLYVMPQRDARFIWHSKRLFPNSYRVGVGLASRFMFRHSS